MTEADRLSFQLYSLRRYRDLPAQLDLLSAIGYRRVETTWRDYADPAATRALLEARGMTAPTGHFPFAAIRERTEWVAMVAEAIGLQQVVMAGPFEGDDSFDAAQWRAAGVSLAEPARRLAGHGLRLALHNHALEAATLPDGRSGLAHLFAGAGEAPLFWQADLGWLARAGHDPGAFTARHPGRLISCHIKDIMANTAGAEEGWADIGFGLLDWPALWPASRAAGAEWMVVEHDAPADPERSARRSFAYVSALDTTTGESH